MAEARGVDLVDAYGNDVQALEKTEITRSLGGKHKLLSFEPPVGYLSPKKIVCMDGVEPCYTDTFLMMDPDHPLVKFPWSHEQACRMNLKEASKSVLLAGLRLSDWIDWKDALEQRMDRGWYKVKLRDGRRLRPSLLETILKSGAMTEVSGALHKPPNKNKKFNLVKSFKTIRNGPSLQVTLWHYVSGRKGTVTGPYAYRHNWVAEIDIDLKTGVGHWAEVVQNHLTEGKTHPYLVNQLLAWYWGVISFKLEISGAKSG